MSSFSATLLAHGSVLVTGASGGIGQALVRELVECGAVVFANARNTEPLNALIARFPTRVIPLQYDVTSEQQVNDAFRTIQKRQKEEGIGPLIGLVNNAGVMQESPLMTTSLSRVKAHMDINFVAAFQHMQLAARLMSRNRRGAMVNIVSQIGEQGGEGMSAYAASKAALTGATKSLAKELAAVGIRVNAVAPGFIETPLTSHYDESDTATILNRCRLKRPGTAREVAQSVVFLLSDASAYTTGQVLAVDGLFQA